jgi:hypothetical protein
MAHEDEADVGVLAGRRVVSCPGARASIWAMSGVCVGVRRCWWCSGTRRDAVCTQREDDVLGLVTMGNGMLVLVNHLLSSTKDHVWHVYRVKSKGYDKVRERGKVQW